MENGFGQWNLAWKWQGPEHIRTFLFHCLHDHLLTNKERVQRRLTNGSFCSRCHSTEESILHVLRDCSFAIVTWTRIVPREQHDNFFASSASTWLSLNLSTDKDLFNDISWSIIFGVTC